MAWHSLALLEVFLLLWTATPGGQATEGSCHYPTKARCIGTEEACQRVTCLCVKDCGINNFYCQDFADVYEAGRNSTTPLATAPGTAPSNAHLVTTGSPHSNSGSHTDISFSAVVGSSLLVLLSLRLM